MVFKVHFICLFMCVCTCVCTHVHVCARTHMSIYTCHNPSIEAREQLVGDHFLFHHVGYGVLTQVDRLVTGTFTC